MNTNAFNESLFEKKLLQLRETHESISNLSTWCLAHQSHHTKLISIWLSVLKRVKIEHRLLLFYLANDIIQYSRRKHLPFVESFAPALQKATTMVREDSVKNKILRLFKIWDDRGIYDEAFLLDLSGLLICDPKGGSRMDIQDFHPNVMYSRIRSCKKLEDDTDIKLKILNESQLPITNVEQLRKNLKDREHGEDVMEDVENAQSKIKAYVDALEAEIKERSGLLDMLDTGEQYYEKDLREAKIVVNAYKCFGQRVKQVQKKLEEKMPALPSPVPSPPDVNAPSPSPPMSPEEEREDADFGACNFTMGESFINNTSIIEKALDSQGSTVYTEKPDYFAPPVYTPSMTTGSGVGREVPYTPSREVTLNTSHYDSADTSYNSQFSGSETVYNNTINNSTYDDDYIDNNARNSQYNSDSQLSNESYPAEYFIGANSSDATYPNERGERNLEPSVFSSLMDSKGTLLPPPPPPPPPKSPLNSESTDENKIEVIGGSTKQPSLAEILKSLIAKKEENPTVPLKPPPLPPTSLQEDEVWQENDWDSPLSPTPFQDFPAEDTDMRPKDVDHRNLISLTGWDSKNSDEASLDKDERTVRSKLYQDTDSSDSRSPPDHLPRLNLGPMDVPPPPIITTPDMQTPPPVNFPPTNLPPPNMPPPNLLIPNMLPPNRPANHNNVPPPNRPMNHSNVSPLNRPMNHGNGPPLHRPMNHGNIPPVHVPLHLRHPNLNRLPPPLQPPPQFDFNGIRPPQENPLDNVENIDMEMSDEEDRKETSPTLRRDRAGLVPLTPNADSKVAEKSCSPKTSSLPPPPSPNMSLLKSFPSPSPPVPPNMGSPPVVELPLTPTRPPRSSMRMMGPPNQERVWISPGFVPRQSHPMFQSPRQPFFNQGPARPFRPRHFRPRFPPRW